VRGTRTLIPLGLAGQNYLGVVFLGVPGLTDLSPTGVTAVVATIAIGAVLVLALTHLYAFMTVDPRDAVQRVGRLGYVVAGAGSREEAAAAVRRTQRGLATANAGYLVLVALAPWVLDHALGVSPSVASYCGTHMLVLAAVAMQVAAQARQELALGVARWQRGNDEPWVSVWTAETELEVELGQRLLRQAGIPASPRCNRVVAATGTLSYWEVARPRWPGLTIHRRLGGGGAQLLVPEGEVARARDLLEGQARD